MLCVYSYMLDASAARPKVSLPSYYHHSISIVAMALPLTFSGALNLLHLTCIQLLSVLMWVHGRQTTVLEDSFVALM